jgi:hypothetical protein
VDLEGDGAHLVPNEVLSGPVKLAVPLDRRAVDHDTGGIEVVVFTRLDPQRAVEALPQRITIDVPLARVPLRPPAGVRQL